VFQRRIIKLEDGKEEEKKSLLKKCNFIHHNFLREMEISLLLDYKVYLQMFFSFFG
jgi:hypothetical protein